MRAKNIARNFWVKGAALLIAALLMPVMAVYGAIYAASYTGALGSGDFYDSDLCRSAVSNKSYSTWHIYQEYRELIWDTNALTDWLTKAYPADSTVSNVRFALSVDGTEVYDNHRGGDVELDIKETYWPVDEGTGDTKVKLSLTYYVDPELPVRDQVYQAYRLYQAIDRLEGRAIPVLLLCALAELFLIVYLARTAGRRPGTEEVLPGWQEHIPFDLYLAADFFAGLGLVWLGGETFGSMGWSDLPLTGALLLACIFVGAALLGGLWMTFCARMKLGKWWRNTVTYKVLKLLWRVLKAIGRGIRSIVRALPLVWRTALGCCVLVIALTALAVNHAYGALLVVLILLALAACWVAVQLRRLQKAGQALAAGDLTAQVNTRGMLWDLKRHGEDLNAVGRGMSIAVEEQLKSERLKTELITNVSHDIKTPLTSIVNYVDLLQRPHTPEQETEYLEVLARQSRKLKKLTEDLVEMSKASAGSLPCHPAPRRVKELVEQAVGEYADRLAAARLEPVLSLPEDGVACMADGALIWRVLDNLLGNACKYAQPGTRLYIGGVADGRTVTLSFKNVSRDALNISADELMERFVRGDASRTTEGSGLGLNIAKSLMELQGGSLSLSIDGDLFKAQLTLPQARDATLPAPELL